MSDSLLTSRSPNGESAVYVFEQNRELQELLDAMRAIIFYLDNWGTVQHCNRRAEEWHVGCVRGKNFCEFAQGWDDPSERQREIMQVIRSGRPILQSIEAVVDGQSEHWFNVDKIPTQDSKGHVNGVLLVLNDITESKLKERELQQSEDRYRAYIANSEDAIWCYDLNPPVDVAIDPELQVEQILQRSVLGECNDRLAKILRAISSDALLGASPLRNGFISNKHDVTEFVCRGYRLYDTEFKGVDEMGERLVMQSSAMGIVENGYLTRVWGTTRDVTDKRRYLDKLEYLANHDPLTSLPNRALLFDKMNDAFRSKSAASSTALLLIDLDRFKEINDTLGHLAGDKVLKQLGSRLEVELGEMPGMVARLGGDEFAVFLPKIRNSQHAVVLAHRFLDCICQVFEIGGFQTEISASVGVAVSPEHATDATTLMRYADVAMYNAKSRMAGISLYNASFDSHTTKRLALMGAIGTAIREGQLCLQYQPKISLHDRRVFGFEALIRWNHPAMGFIPPGEFVPIVEMSSFIYAMTSWVLEQTIKQCAIWREQGYEFICAMNLSARNLLDDRIVLDLDRCLKKYSLPGESLEIEITESTLMSDPERGQIALEKIDQLGVSLAIDDYGTGYSSLAYLKRLPVSTLKLDGSFVQGMIDDEQDRIIVSSTVQLAHNLGLYLVAEGVETPDVLEELVALGCDSAQGYFIARPLDANKVLSWVDESSWGGATT